MEEIVVSREWLDNHQPRGWNIVHPPGYKQPIRKSYRVWCVGCHHEIKIGETVNTWKVAANHVYCHPHCMEKLKEKNYNCWKYSQTKQPSTSKEVSSQTTQVKDSETDDRDKHLFDEPEKW